MKTNFNLLVDEHLDSLEGINNYEADPFFYTRLKARMQDELQKENWYFPLKPVWIIGSMALLLVFNVIMISVKNKNVNNQEAHGIKGFAASYDQTIVSF